jgi:colanic acid/amylovoran biosynthesis glycosyltransferase
MPQGNFRRFGDQNVTYSLAYLAPTLPTRSETFVYREVRALRKRGWKVLATSLRRPHEDADGSLADLFADLIVVYQWLHVIHTLSEAMLHPIRSAATLLLALRDAINPGETMALSTRLKLTAQAVAGITLANRLRIYRIQHIHCHFAHAPTTVGMYAAKQLGITFSFTGHANDLFPRRALLKRKLERASFIACISRWHARLYNGIVPQSNAKYPVIRCGVDINEWEYLPRPDASDRALKILTVCRLVGKKGVDTLLRAVAMSERSLELTVAGDGPERVNLERLASELNCQQRVRWLGAVDNEVVLQLMKDADIFVLPCRTAPSGDRDGLPVVLMEAMACGLPVISGTMPAILELIEHGSNGLLVAENDASQLAREIRNLTDDVRNRLATAGRATVENEFSLEETIARLEGCLRTVLRDAAT